MDTVLRMSPSMTAFVLLLSQSPGPSTAWYCVPLRRASKPAIMAMHEETLEPPAPLFFAPATAAPPTGFFFNAPMKSKPGRIRYEPSGFMPHAFHVITYRSIIWSDVSDGSFFDVSAVSVSFVVIRLGQNAGAHPAAVAAPPDAWFTICAWSDGAAPARYSRTRQNTWLALSPEP